VMGRAVLAALLTGALLVLATAPAGAAPNRGDGPRYAARDFSVVSFDGARINAHLLPAKDLRVGQRAPTVLVGSGWSVFAYPDWLGTADSISFGSFSLSGSLLGPATLSAEGYNVITWNNRGWWGSGGQVWVDDPAHEGRDVSALLDWLAQQPEAALDRPGDPTVGMTGASYGGGIQVSAAMDDHRIDVIEPNMSWSSLIDALYPNQTIKAAWGNLLCAASGLTGANRPPELVELCRSAITGVVLDESVELGHRVSPEAGTARITAPTLLLGGAPDTLFPLSGNVDTYRYLRAAGTPVKMMWFCGGHGVCLEEQGPAGHVVDVQLAFLARYLQGARVDVGPGFEYLDQDGTWRSAPSFPPRSAGTVTAAGSGWLDISPQHDSGFLGIVATRADNALEVPIPAPERPGDLVEPPTLTLTYRGRADRPTAPVFAQLVDEASGVVLANQATPTQLTLDGTRRTVRVELEPVSWHLTPSSRLTLQVTDASNLFFAQQATGRVRLDATLDLPLSVPGRSSV